MKRWYRTEKFFLTKILIVFTILTQKLVTKLSEIWGWDPRSGIRKKIIQIPDPGSRGQKAPDPESGSATLMETIMSIEKNRIKNFGALVPK